ncbi:TniQ family protein [Phenylobacterium sp. LjRoot164]|uniref:TniQ family protein n=1 Tax=unclassified Phenylobacterium TaxID=2640670 RepID=UPI003ED0DC25
MRRRLAITVPPIAGESLMSLIVRHGQANFVARPADLLAEIGIETAVPSFVPFTQTGRAQDLAAAFGASLKEIEDRLHPTIDDEPPARVMFNGIALERRFVEAKVRRVSPLGLKGSPHQRAYWQVRPLKFCPESMEMLIEECSACRKEFGWARCHDLLRCDRCNEPIAQEPNFVPPQFAQSAAAVAKLVSHVDDDRERTLRALPSPFCNWGAGDVFAAVVELGAAITAGPRSAQINKKVAVGDFDDFGLAELDAGFRCVAEWPSSLTDVVRAEYEQSATPSFRGCLGGLAKFLAATARPSPLRDLLRGEVLHAIGQAGIPLKRSSRLSSEAGWRETVVVGSEAEAQFGIARRQLLLLQGRSQTFVGGRTGRGGTELYDRARLAALAAGRDASMSDIAAAKLLGLPAFVMPSLVSRGVLERPSNSDLALIFPNRPRVVKSAVTHLLAQLEELPESQSADAVPLEAALQGFADPHAWAWAIVAILKHQVGVSKRSAEAPFSSMSIDDGHMKVALDGFSSSAGSELVSCLAASRMLGAPANRISEAVRAGLLVGEVHPRNSKVSLASVQAFARKLMFNAEASRRLSCTPAEVRYRMQKLGLRPAHRIAKCNVWNREAFESALNSAVT